MKVFISWSGDLSKRVAESLRTYLPTMIQGLEVFMSSHDIQSGSRWSEEVAGELEESSFGILCLTADNLRSPWLLFEAGSLTKHAEARAAGLLLGGLKPTDVTGPLLQFQHRAFSKKDVEALLRDINGLIPNPLDGAQLGRLFDKFWDDLNNEYERALSETVIGTTEVTREPADMLEEILTTVRNIQRSVGSSRPLEPLGDIRLSKSQFDAYVQIVETEESGVEPSVSNFQYGTLVGLQRQGLITWDDDGNITSLKAPSSVTIWQDE